MKNRACNPNMLFDASNQSNCEKVTPKWRQWDTPKSLKINKNQGWDIQGPYWEHPCTQWSPKWCQTVASRSQNAPKWCPRSIKINKFECKPAWNQISILLICECRFAWTPDHFWKILNDSNPADLSNPADPFWLQITNLLVARGAGGRAKPWNCILSHRTNALPKDTQKSQKSTRSKLLHKSNFALEC